MGAWVGDYTDMLTQDIMVHNRYLDNNGDLLREDVKELDIRGDASGVGSVGVHG